MGLPLKKSLPSLLPIKPIAKTVTVVQHLLNYKTKLFHAIAHYLILVKSKTTRFIIKYTHKEIVLPLTLTRVITWKYFYLVVKYKIGLNATTLDVLDEALPILITLKSCGNLRCGAMTLGYSGGKL